MAEQEYADKENPDVPPRQEKVGIANLEVENTRLQQRGDGYKSESETSFARARRAEIENARLQARVEEAEEVRRSSVNEVLREKEAVEEQLRCAEALVEELETEREEHRQHAQNYKALAERRGEAPEPCEKCGGEGRITNEADGAPRITSECPKCLGSGVQR